MHSRRFRGGRGVGARCFAAALCLVALACSGDKEEARGQLMLALQTDMALPKDVSSVRILVLVNGAPRFDRTYPVGPDGAKIPATLAIVAGDDPSTPVEIKVLAFRDSEVRTLNRTITTIPESRVALLRVPIEWLCEGSVRGTGEEDDDYASSCEPDGSRERACAGGECRDVVVSSAELPAFEPADVFGGGTPDGGGRCFPVQRCFDDGFAVTPNARCRVELETDADAPLNFAVIPASGDGACSEESGTCYVPLDRSTFGWAELDSPGGGRRVFELPSAVCARLDDGSALGVRGTTACDTKTLAAPPCGPGSSVDEPLEPGEKFPVTPVGAGGAGGAGGQGGESGGAPAQAGEGGAPVVSGGAGGVPSDAGAGGAPADAGAGGDGGAGPDSPCEPNPCANGTCTDEGGVAACECFADFHGDHCETPIASMTGTGFVDGGTLSSASATSSAGDFVVGHGSTSGGTPVAFVWSPGSGATALPDLSSVAGSTPLAISADGSTVVGSSYLENGVPVAVKWELVGSQALGAGEVTVPVGGTVMVMGPTPLGSIDPHPDSKALDVSADGSVIVGDAGIGSGGPVPFIWTESTGMVSLGFVGSAVAVSDDGRVVACNDVNGALFWTEEDGTTPLGPLNEETAYATDISGDGTTIVGVSNYYHFRWSLEHGVESGYLTLNESSLTDISSNYDASALAGSLNSGQAALWDEANGWRYLSDALSAAGVDFDGWFFEQASGISSDGSLVVGVGQDPDAMPQGFVARLPLPVNVRDCVDPDPCLAGGVCSERKVGYTCDCPVGRLGRNCGLLEISAPNGQRDPSVNALNADGSIYAGTTSDDSGYYYPTLWTSPSTGQTLPLVSGAMAGSATGISADGTVVVGDSGSQAFRWTLATGAVGLGFIPSTASEYTYAWGVSADGSTVVGWGYDSNNQNEAFRWQQGTGLVGLGQLPNGNGSQAYAVNGDGSVVVGQSNAGGTYRVFRWTEADGMVELTMPGDSSWAAAYGVSDDGSVVVGSFQSASEGTRPYRWTQASGVVELTRPPNATDVELTAVSADGNVIIGRAYTPTRMQPVVWRASHGLVYLPDLLHSGGIDSAGLHLEYVNAISKDGRIVTGTAADTFGGTRRAWIVELPP